MADCLCGRDIYVWDTEDRQYLDFLAGFGAVNLGHNPPRLVERMQRFLAEDAFNLCHIGPSPQAAALAAKLAELAAPLTVSMFSSSGAEAVEAGFKLARVATRRKAFLYCQGGFHGTNLGSLSVMGSTRLRKPFEPLLADCTAIPFGNVSALQKELAKKTYAAFLLEPIQGEGGIVFPPPEHTSGHQRGGAGRLGPFRLRSPVRSVHRYALHRFISMLLRGGRPRGAARCPAWQTM